MELLAFHPPLLAHICPLVTYRKVEAWDFICSSYRVLSNWQSVVIWWFVHFWWSWGSHVPVFFCVGPHPNNRIVTYKQVASLFAVFSLIASPPPLFEKDRSCSDATAIKLLQFKAAFRFWVSYGLRKLPGNRSSRILLQHLYHSQLWR